MTSKDDVFVAVDSEVFFYRVLETMQDATLFVGRDDATDRSHKQFQAVEYDEKHKAWVRCDASKCFIEG